MKLSPIPQSRSPESNFLSSKHSSMNDSKDDSISSSSVLIRKRTLVLPVSVEYMILNSG